MTHYLLLGGAGFVGLNLARRLVRDGAAVTVADNMTFTQRQNLDCLRSLGCKLEEGDVRDVSFLDRAIGKDVDGVFHLASLVGIKNYLADPVALIDINIVGTRNVAEFCLKRGVRLLFTSTSEVLGRNEDVPWTESADRVYGAPTVDRWAYGASKGVAEQLLNAMHRQKGLRSIIVRFFNVYGPFQRPYFVASKTLHHFLLGKPPLKYDTGAQSRCFTYIEDAVDALALLVRSETSVGQTYNIGSRFEHTVSDAIAIIGEICDSAVQPQTFDTGAEYGKLYEDIYRRIPDVSKIAAHVNWHAQTDFRTGMTRFRDWTKENRWWLEMNSDVTL